MFTQLVELCTYDMKRFIVLVFIVFTSFHLSRAVANESSGPSVANAFLDTATVDSPSRIVHLSGWAVPEDRTTDPLSLHVFVGGDEIYSGSASRLARPDVARAANRSDWLNSGWALNFTLPATVKSGQQSLRVDVQFGLGQAKTSVASQENASIDVPAPPPRHWTSRVAIIAGVACVVFPLLFAPALRNACRSMTGRQIPAPAFAAGGVVVCFLIFVCVGVSGSSIPEAQSTIPIQGIQTTVLANTSRSIRSDEWVVVTPSAIGQVRHQPPFPIVNRNMGPDGHNMLVIGMTSVPVWGIAAIARPATWGFFFLPLPQALAWHWWLPVFGCVLAVWACLATLYPLQWRMTLALSLCFVMSPYVVAWSYWPAYVTMFAAATFSAVVALLRTTNIWPKLATAALIVIGASGFALTLYPAWQVPLAYLFAPLLVAVLYRDRTTLRFAASNLIIIGVSLVLAGLILLAWWLDAKDAIHAMMATVYPGQRNAAPGGERDPWFLARGFTNFQTMYWDLRGVSNASEIASFVYFFVPTLFAAFVGRAHLGRHKIVFFTLVGFLAVALWYQFIGFPIELAKFSLWGRTLPKRVDLAVGIASIALIGAAFSTGLREAYDQLPRRHLAFLGPGAAALIWTAAVWLSMKQMPPSILDQFSAHQKMLLLLIVALCSFALAARWAGIFLVAYLAVLIVSVLPFNPWTLISKPPIPSIAKCGTAEERTLVLSSHVPAMTMMASGCPVLNGVSYYPQESLWRVLDPKSERRDVFNRYQQLVFNAEDLHESTSPSITSPQADLVAVGLDSRAFNFRQLPIEYVVVPTGGMRQLEQNPSLRRVAPIAPSWERFKVVR
ncbi:hypothetical protein PWR66_03415 [Paraburkholderia sp. A1RO-5]|uniref:DUF7657 domain-containing protein n=1 Tax=Paraburkholderia sp. A1RO-5 TaxID=3028369 RepID=UPI003B79F07B